jgi:cytochrome c-type biogenesis protein CcmH/NrfG
MRKAIIAFILILPAALIWGCDSESDRPIVPQGGYQQPSLNVDSQVQFLHNVVKEDPKNVSAWVKLGNVTMDAQRFEEAVEAYGKALELDPTDTDVRVDQGICYRRIGRSDKAVEAFKKTLEYDPTHLNAHKNLGVVLGYDFRMFNEAADHFQKYLDLAPAAPDRTQVEAIIKEFREAAGAHPATSAAGSTP